MFRLAGGNRGTEFTEGDEGRVVVERNEIRPSRPVEVIVTAHLFSFFVGLLDGEHVALASGMECILLSHM